jgi:hypothetical protein
LVQPGCLQYHANEASTQQQGFEKQTDLERHERSKQKKQNAQGCFLLHVLVHAVKNHPCNSCVLVTATTPFIHHHKQHT